MGQDTYSNFGISTSSTFNFTNLPLIKKIYDIPDIELFISNDNYNDEVTNIEQIEVLDNFIKYGIHDTVEEYETEEIQPYHNIQYYALIPVVTTYARNISRRKNPLIYSEYCVSVEQVFSKINTAQQLFLDIGIPKENIRTGYSFIDSC